VLDGTGARSGSANTNPTVAPVPAARAGGDVAPQPYRAGIAGPERVPANGSQPRTDLGSARDPDVLGAAPDDEEHGLVPASWSAYLPAREMGIRIFIAGLIALAIAIAGLATVATRRRP
jgi:hypothetical protein